MRGSVQSLLSASRGSSAFDRLRQPAAARPQAFRLLSLYPGCMGNSGIRCRSNGEGGFATSRR
jgi:hypothetical protein